MHDDAIEVLEAYLLGQRLLVEKLTESFDEKNIFIDQNRTDRIQASLEVLKNINKISSLGKGVMSWLN